MADIQRIVRLTLYFLVGILLGANLSIARADYPAVGKWSYPWATSSGGFASVAAVCAYDITIPSWQSSWPGYTFTCENINQPSPVTPGQMGSYQVKAVLAPYSPSYSNRSTTYYLACPSGGTLTGETCVVSCPAGQHDDGTGQCVADCSAGSAAGYYSTGFGTTACIAGCSYTRSAAGAVSACSGWSDSTGWSSCYLAQSGSNCSTPNGAPANNLPSQCPVGQCPGTVNGASVCVSCSGKTDVQSTSTTNTSTPGGPTTSTTTTTNTTTNTTNNTTSTTSTTSTTTTPPGGPPTTTEETKTEEGPADKFCIENPDSPLCKLSSFGGSCGAFSCDGDAIQCAMAKEQHRRNCTMFDTPTPLSQLGDQIAAGNDPQAANYPTAPGQQQTINLGSAIDTTNPLAAGCLQDKSFTFMSTTLVIPFSNICPYLEMMGQIVLAFSLLMAARITFSGV